MIDFCWSVILFLRLDSTCGLLAGLSAQGQTKQRRPTIYTNSRSTAIGPLLLVTDNVSTPTPPPRPSRMQLGKRESAHRSSSCGCGCCGQDHLSDSVAWFACRATSVDSQSMIKALTTIAALVPDKSCKQHVCPCALAYR